MISFESGDSRWTLSGAELRKTVNEVTGLKGS